MFWHWQVTRQRKQKERNVCRLINFQCIIMSLSQRHPGPRWKCRWCCNRDVILCRSYPSSEHGSRWGIFCSCVQCNRKEIICKIIIRETFLYGALSKNTLTWSQYLGLCITFMFSGCLNAPQVLNAREKAPMRAFENMFEGNASAVGELSFFLSLYKVKPQVIIKPWLVTFHVCLYTFFDYWRKTGRLKEVP